MKDVKLKDELESHAIFNLQECTNEFEAYQFILGLKSIFLKDFSEATKTQPAWTDIFGQLNFFGPLRKPNGNEKEDLEVEMRSLVGKDSLF